MRGLVFLIAIATLAISISCRTAGGNIDIPNYNMGERAPVGPIIYTVFENRWMPQLGTGATARIPSNRFFVLRLSMLNSGGTEAIAPVMTLIDDNGQRYQELSDGDGVPQWVGYLRRIKPADTLTGNVVFDVPARHYKLELSDETEERKAHIDIPLSFTQESPLVPIPGVPDTTPQPLPVTPK
jgi:hypothetical protein